MSTQRDVLEREGGAIRILLAGSVLSCWLDNGQAFGYFCVRNDVQHFVAGGRRGVLLSQVGSSLAAFPVKLD